MEINCTSINVKALRLNYKSNPDLIKRDFKKAKKYVDIALKDPTLPINYRLRGNDITTRIKNK